MDPLTKELTKSMEDLALFMEAHNEISWASDIRESAGKIARGSYAAVEKMQFWWGTYGTLNDIIIRKFNDGETFESANDSFSALQNKVYLLRNQVIKNGSFMQSKHNKA